MGSILTEIIPRKARLIIYVLLALAGVVFAAYEASEGDWWSVATSVVVTVVGWLAASNVTPPTQELIDAQPNKVIMDQALRRGLTTNNNPQPDLDYRNNRPQQQQFPDL